MIIFRHASDHLPKLFEQRSVNGLPLAQIPTQALGVVMEEGTGGAGTGVQTTTHHLALLTGPDCLSGGKDE